MCSHLPLIETAPQRSILGNGGSITLAVKDWNMLLYLMDFRDMFDWEHFMPRVCGTVAIEGVELEEGDKLMIGSIAGLD